MHASPSPKQFDASSEPIPDVVTINASVPDSVPSVVVDVPDVQPPDVDVDMDMSEVSSPTNAAATLNPPPADQPDSKISSDITIINDLTVQTPENNNMETSPSDTSAVTRPPPDDEDDTDRPPAKRFRRLSDPDQASVVHVCFILYFILPLLIHFFWSSGCEWCNERRETYQRRFSSITFSFISFLYSIPTTI